MLRRPSYGSSSPWRSSAPGGARVSAPPPPPPAPKPPPFVKPKASRFHVVVTVVDGDSGRRVQGAFVRAGALGDYANHYGNAQFRLKRRRPLLVSSPRVATSAASSGWRSSAAAASSCASTAPSSSGRCTARRPSAPRRTPRCTSGCRSRSSGRAGWASCSSFPRSSTTASPTWATTTAASRLCRCATARCSGGRRSSAAWRRAPRSPATT